MHINFVYRLRILLFSIAQHGKQIQLCHTINEKSALYISIGELTFTPERATSYKQLDAAPRLILMAGTDG
jgi:hypothetical protein